MELRIDPRVGHRLRSCRSVPGVVEVNSYGGELKTYEVQLDPDKLVAYDISLEPGLRGARAEQRQRRRRATSSTAGAVPDPRRGLVESLDDIGNIVVAARSGGTPDLSSENLGRRSLSRRMVRQGAVTRDGRGEVVTGVVMMLMGENSRVVAESREGADRGDQGDRCPRA